MKKIYMLFLSFVLLMSCNNDTRKIKTNLITAQELITVPSDVMKNILDSKNIPHGNYVFGYKAYKIVYQTVDDSGNPVKASGLLTVPIPPDNLPKKELYSFPVVLNEHGTIFLDNDAPSYNYQPGESSTFSVLSLFTGIYGFATVMPDYIGYGTSNNHYHPYLIKNSLAKSSVDMLKAVIDFSENNHINMKRDVFITGYSEGGYAAMATAEMLQKEPDFRIHVKAAAPLDGVYDLETIGIGIAASNDMIYPPFVAFIAYSYTETYPKDIIRNQLVQEPYASLLPSLFNGTKSGAEIYSHLTTKVKEFFNPVYLVDFLTNENNPFRTKLRENNTDNWAPSFPLRIVHCGHDDILPYTLAQISYNRMLSLGATDIQLVDPEDVFGNPSGWGHRECAPYAYQIAAKWFCELTYGADKCNQ